MKFLTYTVIPLVILNQRDAVFPKQKIFFFIACLNLNNSNFKMKHALKAKGKDVALPLDVSVIWCSTENSGKGDLLGRWKNTWQRRKWLRCKTHTTATN